MTGKNRIMIYGPKDDGTYVVEFMTADGDVLSISIPRDRGACDFPGARALRAVRAGRFMRRARFPPEAFLPATKSEKWVTVSPIVTLSIPSRGC
jgi:hypothetical protein